MNEFEEPTSMNNLQNSDLLKANDRYRDVCEIHKSNENNKTQETMTIENINILFSQIQQDEENVEQLVIDIYQLSLDNVFKLSVNDYFMDNFPFATFLNIIFDPPSPECESYAFVCLSIACHSQKFPYQMFDNENVLTDLFQELSSEDPSIVNSSLQLLSAITKKSIDSRDFLLQNDIIPTLESMKLTYSVAELLESLCSLDPPPPVQFIPSIAEFISIIIADEKKENEISIIELALRSLFSLLTNEAEGIVADQFLDHFIIFFYDEATRLVPIALKIIMLAENPQPAIPELLLKILEGDDFPSLCDNVTVLLLIAQLFAHFEPIWKPIVQDGPFILLKAKIGMSRFKVDTEIIQTMILYYDNSHINDLDFFNILLRFSDSIEIGCRCMEQILLMIQSQPSPDEYEKMIELLEQSVPAFTDLANGEDEEMAELAECILNQLEENAYVSN